MRTGFRIPIPSKQFPFALMGALLVGSVACGAPGVPLPPTLRLPEAVKDLRATRKGNRVYLAWTVPTRTTDRQTIVHEGPTIVCRNAQSTQKCEKVGEVVAPAKVAAGKEKAQASYVDVLPDSILSNDIGSNLFYAVEVDNETGRSSGLSNQVGVPAFRVAAAPTGVKATATAEGVQVSWDPVDWPSQPDMHNFFRLYREEAGQGPDSALAEIPFGSSPQFLDRGIEWEKQYRYRVSTVTAANVPGKAEMQVESDGSPEIAVVTHDTFPPAVPEGLQAVFSGPGQPSFIDLTWSPVRDADLAGYHVYRREGTGSASRVTNEMVHVAAFRDSTVQAGKTYSYSVSAVDLRGNESAPSQETSESTPP